MNSKIEYNVQGAFKLDLLSGGKVVSSTDYFSNFITQTGLMFPSIYAFADCFRYLSLGSSTIASSGATSLNQLGTTGLYNPITSFSTSEGTLQSAKYINWEGYVTGSDFSNCGTVMSEFGPRFYRAWYVPTGNNPEITLNEAAGGLTIGEFMVSPSSGSDPTGKYAFSRVVRNLFIPNGYRAIVSYQLKINIKNTGRTILSSGSFATGNAEVENDLALIQGWKNLSGYYKQVYHGLRLIDNAGLTYVPKFGDVMEPSTRNLTKTVWYLSPDNSQFDTNPTGGTLQTDVGKAYAADGLMSYIKFLDLRYVSNSSIGSLSYANKNSLYNDNNPSINSSLPKDNILSNIHLGRTSSPLMLPQVGNYRVADASPAQFTYQSKQNPELKAVSYATPGAKGYRDDLVDYGKQATFTSFTIKQPIIITGQNTITGRKKTITRKSAFSPVNSFGHNTRFGSLVYAFGANTDVAGDKLYYPMIDCLFFDSSGRSLMPHYRFVTGIVVQERGSGVLDVKFALSGSGANGIFYKFTGHRTFQGPSQDVISHPKLTELIFTSGGNNYYSGFLGSGNSIASGISGSTSDVVVSGNLVGYGFGVVYGLVVDSGFYVSPPDLGLTDHSTGLLIEPSNTGLLYWPTLLPQNSLFLTSPTVSYYTTHIPSGVIQDTGWFGSNQIIEDISFQLLDSNFNSVIPGTGFHSYVTGNIGKTTAVTVSSGYFLSAGVILTGESAAPLEDYIVGPNGSFSITGYVIPKSIINGKLFGTVWKDAGNIPLNSYRITPQLVSRPVSGAIYKLMSVTGFFSLADISGRGYPNATGAPFKSTDELYVFFTGFSGNSPLYLTYLTGISGGNSITGHGFSNMSGYVSLTKFYPPDIKLIHSESGSSSLGWKLAPNFSSPNYYGSNIPSLNQGGEYPALSLDNGLELYLDLLWSSPCGPTTQNCLEPV